jgi:hypothetical protein
MVLHLNEFIYFRSTGSYSTSDLMAHLTPSRTCEEGSISAEPRPRSALTHLFSGMFQLGVLEHQDTSRYRFDVDVVFHAPAEEASCSSFARLH